MADRRTKAHLKEELRMVYEENDKLRMRIALLENDKAIVGVLQQCEALYAKVAGLLPSTEQKT